MACNRARKIYAIVPAYNEAETIVATIQSLQAQWTPRIDEIIVVPNNCTDSTAQAAFDAGATVWEFPGRNPHRKAGALNWAIAQILEEVSDEDMILVTDADSHLVPEWTGHALRAMLGGEAKGRLIGAVCANFHVHPEKNMGLLGRMQGNEYARFALQVTQRQKAIVLSGVGTLFRVTLLQEILAARASGRLPGYAGELYHRDTATEDIELTFAVKTLGYTPLAPKEAVVWTDAMPTWKALKDQRIRWQRGMIDSLRLYGLSKFTAWEILKQVAIYVASLLAPAYLVFLTVVTALTGEFPFDLRWLPLTGLFIAERLVTVLRTPTKNKLLALAIVPEWCYEQYRSFVYWIALFKSFRRAEHVWINA